MPEIFDTWREIRVDLEPSNEPDILSSITDLSEIPDGVADAVWTSHCLEHLFAHEVPTALGEFRRILNDSGFLCLFVPDLQTVAEWIASDKLGSVAYESAAGPVTPHDMVYGFSQALKNGFVHMAHNCGFTRTLLSQLLTDAGYGDFVLRRHPQRIELGALAAKHSLGSEEHCSALVSGLGL